MKVPHTKKGIRRLLGIKKVADIPKKLSPREKAVAALRVMKLFQVSAWDYFKELWEEKVKEGTIQEWTTRNGTTPSVKTGKANLRDLHIRIADYLGFDSRELVTKAPPLSGTSSANTSNASTSSAKTSSGSLSEPVTPAMIRTRRHRLLALLPPTQAMPRRPQEAGRCCSMIRRRRPGIIPRVTVAIRKPSNPKKKPRSRLPTSRPSSSRSRMLKDCRVSQSVSISSPYICLKTQPH